MENTKKDLIAQIEMELFEMKYLLEEIEKERIKKVNDLKYKVESGNFGYDGGDWKI